MPTSWRQRLAACMFRCLVRDVDVSTLCLAASRDRAVIKTRATDLMCLVVLDETILSLSSRILVMSLHICAWQCLYTGQ